MKFTASSEKFLEERMPGVKVPPGHWTGRKTGRSLQLRFIIFLLEVNERVKYRSRTGVGNFASVFCPLVVMTMFMGKGSVEDITNVRHGVHADG